MRESKSSVIWFRATLYFYQLQFAKLEKAPVFPIESLFEQTELPISHHAVFCLSNATKQRFYCAIRLLQTHSAATGFRISGIMHELVDKEFP
jgi:hypothetical protein